jgi:hypothetical protein
VGLERRRVNTSEGGAVRNDSRRPRGLYIAIPPMLIDEHKAQQPVTDGRRSAAGGKGRAEGRGRRGEGGGLAGTTRGRVVSCGVAV